MEQNALINGNCVLKFDNNCQMLDSQESWSKREVVPGRDWTFISWDVLQVTENPK